MARLPPALALGAALAAAGCSPDPGDAPEVALQAEHSYLDETQRLRLFDLEQADLRLGKALGPFCGAIREEDEEGVRRALAPGFTAQVPSLDAWAVASAEASLTEADRYRFEHVSEVRTVDLEGFLEWLAELEEEFGEIRTAAFNRDQNDADITEGRATVSGSSGVFRIAGTTDDGGLLELSGRFRMRHAGMDEDFETLDHWIHGLELQDARLIAYAKPLFVETTDASGLENEGLHDNWLDQETFRVFSGGAFLDDVNRDDHLDLLVTERTSATLYLGRGDGTFERHPWEPRRFRKKFACENVSDWLFAAIFDATGDGYKDVLCGGTLYRWAPKAETLVPVKGATRLPNADLALADYDGDGLVDVYLLNAGAPAPQREILAWFDNDRVTGLANVLLKNLGGGRFQDVTEESGASPGHGRTFAAAFFYANDDPWPDLFGANEFGRNVMLANKGDGTFEEAPPVDPVFGGFSMGVSTGDLDGDGRVDLYVANMYSKAGHRVFHHLDLEIYPEEARPFFMSVVSGNRFYRSNGDLTFEDQSKPGGVNAVGWGWSGAVADFDLDGWLDVYAPCGHRSVSRTEPDG